MLYFSKWRGRHIHVSNNFSIDFTPRTLCHFHYLDADAFFNAYNIHVNEGKELESVLHDCHPYGGNGGD